MTFKKAIRKIHLWLGLVSGPVVFLVAITGSLYAFQEEIQDLTQPYRWVEPQDEPILPPSEMKAIALEELPGHHVHSVKYGSRERSVAVIFFEPDPEFFQAVFINPYSGKVLKTKDLTAGFFHFILQGHYYLWLPEDIGQTVVASATLVFLVIVTSGLILWWPATRGAFRQRSRFKWKPWTKWRKKVYDLHNILGFYILLFALIFAITGLVWGFQWFEDAVYKAAGGDKSLTFERPPSDTTQALAETAAIPPVDHIWQRMEKQNPEAAYIDVHFPTGKSSSIYMEIRKDEGTFWRSDYRFFDQYTLEELSIDQVWARFENASVADKLLRMNYDIHVGAILGFPGKVLACLVSLVIASLPVTGFLVWYGRRRGRKVGRG